MNILIVSAMFPPIRTGTSFYANNLANALVAQGHKITVVTVDNDDSEDHTFEYGIHRLRSLKIPMKSFFKHFRISSIFPRNYRKIREIAKNHESDVVFLVNHYLDIAFPAISVSRKLGIPLVCSVGTQLQSTKPWRNTTLNILDRLICGMLIFPFCHKIIAWDRQILKYLVDVQGQKIKKKTEIINFAPHGDTRKLADAEHDYRLKYQVLGVGAVTEQRDFIPLIKAFKHVLNEVPDARLKIIGHVYNDAAVRLAEETGVSEKVEFCGEQDHDRVLDEMSASDAFYVSLSGKYLGLGTATLEAMLTGIPVMANVPTDLLGTVELKDREDFMYMDIASPEIIASDIVSLLLDDQLRERIGRGGKSFVMKNLNWDKVGKDMSGMLERVNDEHRSRKGS